MAIARLCTTMVGNDVLEICMQDTIMVIYWQWLCMYTGHHHTVQAVIRACNIWTSGTRKRPPVQIAEGNHHKCRLSVCTSCWDEKHHQRKFLKVRGTRHKHPLAQIGAGCSNNMQLAHRHNYEAWKCPCASSMLLLHPTPTSDGILRNLLGMSRVAICATCGSLLLWVSRIKSHLQHKCLRTQFFTNTLPI